MIIQRPIKRKSSTAAGVVGLLVATAALCALLSQAKPVLVRRPSPFIEQVDPMLALPSGQRQQVIYVEQPQAQQQQQPQEVHYVYSNVQQATADSGEPSRETVALSEQQYLQQAAGQPDQYLAHQPEAPYQLIQVQAEPAGGSGAATQLHQHQDGMRCNKRHEYSSLIGSSNAAPPTVGETRAEYPGEILYIGQNSELLGQQAGGRAELPDLAQNSGMPATILTEIPINDMPADVLEKLKKEYGVKIVATRERPGANLVINCDDYTNQDNSICQKQQLQSQQVFASQPLEHQGHQPQGSPLVYSLDEHQPQQRRQHRYRTSHHHHQELSHLSNQEDDLRQRHRHNHEQHDVERSAAAAVADALARSQAESSQYEPQPPTNYSAEAPEARAVEYVHVDAQPDRPTSPADGEATAHEAYGTRTTVSADEQADSVGAPPTQPQQHPGPQAESTPGQPEVSNGAETTVSATPENDPRHAGFDEQPTRLAEPQEHSNQAANESPSYIDRT